MNIEENPLIPSPDAPLETPDLSVKTSSGPKTLFLLVGGILLMALGGIAGYYFGTNKPQAPDGNTPEGVACTMEAKLCPDGSAVGRMPPTCEFAPCPTPEAGTLTPLPPVTRRSVPTIEIYSSWETIEDTGGFAIKHPPAWYTQTTEGLVNQIQNWNPATVVNPGTPLSDPNAKWDIGFMRGDVTTINELLMSASKGMRVETVEESKTARGIPVYFIQGTGSMFGNEDIRVPIITAIFIEGDKFFVWHGIAYGEGNREILKQIAESLE